MSHLLDITRNQAFFAARGSAWHRLGTVFDRAMTADEALDAAHLRGWNVRTVELGGAEITASGVTSLAFADHRGVVRTNPITGDVEPLGVVGASYQHIQNEQQVEFLSALLDESGAHIETAGSLRGGRQVFFTCKLPQSMLVGGVDRVDTYIAALNGHDGSMAFKAIVTPVRVVCANTQHAALRSAAQSWSARHTTGATKAVAEARRSLELSFKFVAQFEAEAERMIQQTITDAQFEAIIGKLYDTPAPGDTKRTVNAKVRKLDDLRSLMWSAVTQSEIRGTAWAAYQAVGEFEDHYMPVRAAADRKDTQRALRAIDGAGVGVKQAAFDLLRVPA